MHSPYAKISACETIANPSAVSRAEAAQHHLGLAATHLGQCLSRGAQGRHMISAAAFAGSLGALSSRGGGASVLTGSILREDWGRGLETSWDIDGDWR